MTAVTIPSSASAWRITNPWSWRTLSAAFSTRRVSAVSKVRLWACRSSRGDWGTRTPAESGTLAHAPRRRARATGIACRVMAGLLRTGCRAR